MERGVALVIVLVLLAILTMLMVGGAGTATAELAMAGNEQYREHASNAASTGIELELARIAASHSPGSVAGTPGPEAVPGSAIDTYSTTIRYVGDETNLPQSSAEKLIGHHYAIESTGSSVRGAVDQQSQGALLVLPSGGVRTLGRSGGGLSGGSEP